MTDQPFGVNMTVFPTISPPPYAEYIDAIIEGGVKLVETAGPTSSDHWARLKGAGLRIIHKSVAVRHALSAERAGLAAISIQGFACAGHPGEADDLALVLTPIPARMLNFPVLDYGG